MSPESVVAELMAGADACHGALIEAAGDGEALPRAGLFTAGMLGMVMPCTVQMSVVLASVLDTPDRWSGPAAGSKLPRDWAGRLGAFLAGYSIMFVAAAGAAALLVHGAGWMAGGFVLQIAGGLTLTLFGLQIMGWLRLPGGGPCGGPVGFFLGRSVRRTPSPWRMGVSFAMYCAGCCGPAAIGAALLLAGGGSPATAAMLLLMYGVGMALPFIALASGLAFAFSRTRKVLRFTPYLSVAGGVVAIIAGALLALRPLALYLEAAA